MDPARAPWRVLDSDAQDAASGIATSAGPQPESTRDGPDGRIGAPLVALVAGAAVLGLGLVAFLVVATGPQPLAVVQADATPVAAVGTDPSASPSVPATIVVHVAGAVRRPGLVTVPVDARVADAIEAAGGLDARADAARVGAELNLAQHLEDGQRIVVPSRDDPIGSMGGAGSSPATASGSAATGASGPIDLNRADAATLDSLPGIGPVTAAKIIAARTERPFATVDDLVGRKVVSASTLAKFRDRVVVH